MTPDPAPGETLKLLPESTPVLRFVYTSDERQRLREESHEKKTHDTTEKPTKHAKERKGEREKIMTTYARLWHQKKKMKTSNQNQKRNSSSKL